MLDQEAAQPSQEYSRAFETLVEGGDEVDIVGLIAYSLFKSSIRERARGGEHVPLYLRKPTASDKDAYRGRAERILEQYAEVAIEEATPDIHDAARTAAKNEIIAVVKSRTHGGWAIGYGVAAWIRSLVDHVSQSEQVQHQ